MGTVLVLWWLFYVICWILSVFCRVKRYLLSLMVGLAMLMACSKPVKVEVPERFEIVGRLGRRLHSCCNGMT